MSIQLPHRQPASESTPTWLAPRDGQVRNTDALRRISADELIALEQRLRRLGAPSLLDQIDLLHLNSHQPEAVLVLAPLRFGPEPGLREVIEKPRRATPRYLILETFDHIDVDGMGITSLDLLPHIDYIQLSRDVAVRTLLEAESRLSGETDPKIETNISLMMMRDLRRLPAQELASHLLDRLAVRKVYLDSATRPVTDRTVIVTDGEHGSAYAENRSGSALRGLVPDNSDRSGGFHQPAVYETGADDIFAGAMGVGILRGDPTATAMRVASVVRASATQREPDGNILTYKAAARRLLPSEGTHRTALDKRAVDRTGRPGPGPRR
jgi:sugar/nucleoside kinase (ribokinase family)